MGISGRKFAGKLERDVISGSFLSLCLTRIPDPNAAKNSVEKAKQAAKKVQHGRSDPNSKAGMKKETLLAVTASKFDDFPTWYQQVRRALGTTEVATQAPFILFSSYPHSRLPLSLRRSLHIEIKIKDNFKTLI